LQIESAEEAGLVADFVAQCQTHIRWAETTLAELANRVAIARADYEKRRSRRMLGSGTAKRRSRNLRPRAQKALLSADALRLIVDPGWDEPRVLRLYCRRLRDLQNDGPGTATAIATFREVNAPIEARLRTTLPQLMGEIDAIYRWAATHAR
jgi:hypothetical protein